MTTPDYFPPLPGDEVTLLPFEDQPEEKGKVIGVPERAGDPYLIKVQPENYLDDGLREVPAEQLKPKEEEK